MSRRIGLIVPSSNTVAEVDFYRRLPPDCTLHTARMYLEETTPEGESVMLDEHLPRAISDLASARPDVVVFACTSAGALRGNAYETELIARIRDQTGAEAFSVAAAVRRAISSRTSGPVGVITPYAESLNDTIRASLEADRIEVVAVCGMGITDNFTIAAVEPDQIVQFSLEQLGSGGIELLFASCTNLRALDARERAEQVLGVPVVTSNHAALEAVLDYIGASSAV